MIRLALADDEALFGQLLKSFFDPIDDITCLFVATSGEELIDMINEADEKPDLLIIALKMKRLDGAQTVEILKETHPDIRTIVMSSHYSESFTGYMLRTGANAFIPKGVSPQELLEVVRSVQEKGYFFRGEQVEAMRSQIAPRAPKPALKAVESLSEREIDVLKLICQQYTATEIGEKLFISKRTVEGHKNNLFAKTGARNIAGLVLFAVQHDLISQSDLRLV